MKRFWPIILLLAMYLVPQSHALPWRDAPDGDEPPAEESLFQDRLPAERRDIAKDLREGLKTGYQEALAKIREQISSLRQTAPDGGNAGTAGDAADGGSGATHIDFNTIEALLSRAEKGDTEALYQLGVQVRHAYLSGDNLIWGVAVWKEAASRGHADSQYLLALLGYYVMDFNVARMWCDLAFQNRHPNATALRFCLAAAEIDAGRKWDQEVVPLCRKAADGGSFIARHLLARTYYCGGQKIQRDHAQAAKWAHTALAMEENEVLRQLAPLLSCPAFNDVMLQDLRRMLVIDARADCQYLLGVAALLGDGEPQDVKQAIQRLQSAALSGASFHIVSSAETALALCSAAGIGVEQSSYAAVNYYRAAAEKGNALAQVRLADCLHLGQGVKRSSEEAVHWYSMADKLGSDEAASHLEKRKFTIDSIPPPAPDRWLRKFAESGCAWAQYDLGEIYLMGTVIAKDDGEAAKWFALAAGQGHAGAQYRLAQLTLAGKAEGGIDYSGAVELLRKAAYQGHSEAKATLKNMGEW